jgi:hypothetical protein
VSAWPRALRGVLVVVALFCGVGAGWLLDRSGRLPAAPAVPFAATTLRELAQRRLADAPLWVIALGVLISISVPIVALTRQLRQISAWQQAALIHSAAVHSVTRRDSFAARLDSLLDVENAAAQLIANALRRTVVLRPGCLLADALPAPYITVTDMCGTRYLLTAHHKLFLRMGLVPHDAPRGNVSTLSPHAHAEMLAVWDAVQRLKSLAHVAAPAGGDWRVFAIQSARARRSFWHQVRASRRRRALSRLTSRAAALAPVLRVVLPARRSLVVRDIGRQLMAGRGHEMPGLTDAPALRAGDGGDA